MSDRYRRTREMTEVHNPDCIMDANRSKLSWQYPGRARVQSIRSKVINTVHRITPPMLLDAALTFAGRAVHPWEPYRSAEYQGVRTAHNARPLHAGRFAELYEKFYSLDPFIPYDVARYRAYNVCAFGQASAHLPGDFLCAGISYGVTPRVLYDFTNLAELGKTLHLVDPFTAIGETKDKGPRPTYNTDPNYVRQQYPAAAPVLIHRRLIPDALPLPGIDALAFAYLNTSNIEAEAASLPILFEQLSTGGAIVIDRYGAGNGHFDGYDPAIAELGIAPIWFPSGQCVLIKP